MDLSRSFPWVVTENDFVTSGFNAEHDAYTWAEVLRERYPSFEIKVENPGY